MESYIFVGTFALHDVTSDNSGNAPGADCLLKKMNYNYDKDSSLIIPDYENVEQGMTEK